MLTIMQIWALIVYLNKRAYKHARKCYGTTYLHKVYSFYMRAIFFFGKFLQCTDSCNKFACIMNIGMRICTNLYILSHLLKKKSFYHKL